MTIPERGLFTGIAVFGAIGTGKTSGCMYPYAEQLIAYKAQNPKRRMGGLVLEVKGDFCHKIHQILKNNGRQDDYVEVNLNAEYRYNPLYNDLDAYALAYNIASLLTNLFGRGKEPFWQQAYTNLVKFIIQLHKVAYDYVTLFDIYECAINPDLLESRIQEAEQRIHAHRTLIIADSDFLSHLELEAHGFRADETAGCCKAPYSRAAEEALKALHLNYEDLDLCPRGGIMMRLLPFALQAIARWAAISIALSAVLFLTAGTTRVPSLRAYHAAFSLVLLVTMLAVDPQLARERAHPGPDSSKSPLRFLSGLLFLLTLVSAAFLVGRIDALVVPATVRWIALAIFMSSSSLQTWAMIANPFFSPVVRIQADRGHALIDSGPYRFMRHPGYFAMCISVPASAVAIGSWLALIPSGAFIAVIYLRAEFEEQFLKANLPGYAEYAQTVPSGLFHFRST